MSFKHAKYLNPKQIAMAEMWWTNAESENQLTPKVCWVAPTVILLELQHQMRDKILSFEVGLCPKPLSVMCFAGHGVRTCTP